MIDIDKNALIAACRQIVAAAILHILILLSPSWLAAVQSLLAAHHLVMKYFAVTP